MGKNKWGLVKTNITIDGKVDRLRPIEYVPATKSANNVSGANHILNAREAMKQERGIKEKGESEMKIGRFSAAEKTKKFKKTDDDDEALDSQAMTVTAAKKRGSLYTPSGVLQSLKWKRISKAGPGLFNSGNTCFLNSILQCLLHLPALVQPLCDEAESKAILRGMEGKQQKKGSRFILEHFHDFVNEFWGGRPVKALRPTSMVSTIRRVGRQFRPMRQEDAHEYLRQLLDCMHEEILKVHGVKLSDGDVAESTFISRVFGGKLVNELKCSKCKYTSRTYNPFLDLSLEMGGNISTVEQAVAAFLKPEILSVDNAWKCDGCKRPVQASKKLSIAELPNILVLHLKRFTYGRGKINKKVNFPLTLELPSGQEKHAKRDAAEGGAASKAPFSVSGNPQATRAFRLMGVVVHHGGSSHSGHYVAYVCGPNGQWYEMNDSFVSAVNVRRVQEQQAYILFYSSTPAPAPASASTVSNEADLLGASGGKSEGGSRGDAFDMGEAVDTATLAAVRERQELMVSFAQRERARREKEKEKFHRTLAGLDSEDDGSDFDSVDYVDEYQMSSGDEQEQEHGDEAGEEGPPGRLKPALGGIMPMRWPFLSPLQRVVRWGGGRGRALPRSASSIQGLRSAGGCAKREDVQARREEEEEEEEEEEAWVWGPVKMNLEASSSSSGSDSSSEGSLPSSSSKEEEEEEPQTGKESRSRPESLSSGVDDADADADAEGSPSVDIKGQILQLARRGKSTSSEGQWGDAWVDEQTLHGKEKAERQLKKQLQKQRNAKRPSNWDAHLDQGRVKKTKADKEAAKGVHDSFLTEQEKSAKAARLKMRATESSLGDTRQNFFQKVGERRAMEAQVHSTMDASREKSNDQAQGKDRGKYRKNKDTLLSRPGRSGQSPPFKPGGGGKGGSR